MTEYFTKLNHLGDEFGRKQTRRANATINAREHEAMLIKILWKLEGSIDPSSTVKVKGVIDLDLDELERKFLLNLLVEHGFGRI